ncbi:glycoside hydrolase family 3 C-terminal domain-containing protein [Actinoplanes couchii]|uniref:Glycosyl hydrolase n=1 Tax=Actinoplanes couchii TaxID=403638 RepID=A0ABQ3X8F1_9ACTN|nr:glycoside hydrolase family 3 N-terminal domain-containing protein [Actinoplanes couchii]MDR6320198.1 beta-glucosidase [Actinoplanes couchii]GID54788.1 glycosyl hydrolase [Actinoplanes couchii]
MKRFTRDGNLDEKAALLSGATAWTTTPVDRLGIPSIVLTDGPHGVRLEKPDSERFSFENSFPATCFPTAAALGSSWDPDLLTRIGEALGREGRALGVNVLLGPGVNIKRSPLCGRNFEYLSEDPYLTGRLGAALVRGVQSQGVGASVKHFAANNQETERLRVSAEVDERTLREIYLPAFEHIVTEAKPWTVMAAYNRINGVHATQNRWLLTQVLREEWGFDGLVVSDWCAVTDPVEAVTAGLDLEMPANAGSPGRLVTAVREGRLDEALLDRAVDRVLALIERAQPANGSPDFEAHHALARQAAAESAVLLKNEGALLPLAPGTRVAVFGETHRHQGAGSSKIVPTRLDRAVDHLEIAEIAADADVAVLFLGLPEGEESEGFDRTHIDLPADQIRLLEEVAAVHPNTVVVLANGGVVRTGDWERHATAVLEMWLPGQAGGAAVADLLYGRVNPSGRLAETIPLRLPDTPAYLDFPGSEGAVRYGERLYVGYRHHDARDLDVAYPFGHGLSYTTFEYSDLDVTGLTVEVTVTNTGDRPGKEVVQLYVRDVESTVDRPVRELKGFRKVHLEPAESKRVTFIIQPRDLCFYSVAREDWVQETGDFEFSVGASSRDLRLSATVHIAGPEDTTPLTLANTLAEWLADPRGAAVVGEMAELGDPQIRAMVEHLPLDRLIAMSNGRIDAARFV